MTTGRKRGRKSAAELEAPTTATVEPFAPAPRELDPRAASLWRSIVASRPHNYFSSGDWPLLREYCHTVATLIPRVNKLVEAEFDPKTLEARDKLVRQATALARSLRLCVSARTRPDTASMRDSVRGAPILWT